MNWHQIERDDIYSLQERIEQWSRRLGWGDAVVATVLIIGVAFITVS